MSTGENNTLVEVQDLKVHFPVSMGSLIKKKIGDIKAVDGVSFTISRGETLGLVGESGSGKTTTGNALLQLDRPTGGKIFFEGQDITGIAKKEIRKLRRRMQIIFQDPFSSLDPRMKVSDVIGEPLVIHQMAGNQKEYKDQTAELLKVVGLDPSMGDRYPHEFSGGQRQRIGVARALAVKPSFIVCDEPVSALDVSIQAQIINLLEDLQEQFNLTYLFIAHDLSVVRHISNRIAVMYLGKLVEIADRMELYHNPLHPYTRALLSAVPIPNPTVEAKREHIILKGEVPSPLFPPPGCHFHPRCESAKEECRIQKPRMKEISPGHVVSCHLH
jgi:oligopeptide/dipeptide ABC transporter ATP-binding protein